MDTEDSKTGSADSENGSDTSYVQVSQEDAQRIMSDMLDPSGSPQPPLHDSPQLLSGSGMPPQEDLEEGDATLTERGQVQDPFYMESTKEEEGRPPAPPEAPPKKAGGVEDMQSDPVSSTGRLIPVKPAGYLCFLRYLHPAILYIIYWQDLKLSAVVFGVDMVILLTLSLNTFLHTTILLLLSFLVVSLTYIVTKIAIDSFYNRSIRNPFSEYLKKDIVLPEEKLLKWARCLVSKLSHDFSVLVRLLMFDNIKRSLKFGVFLWLISFGTNCFNILTTMFWVTVILFGAPPLYSKYQEQIDVAIQKGLSTVSELFQKVRSLVPFMKKSKLE